MCLVTVNAKFFTARGALVTTLIQALYNVRVSQRVLRRKRGSLATCVEIEKTQGRLTCRRCIGSATEPEAGAA
jgi:hypothetical protein